MKSLKSKSSKNRVSVDVEDFDLFRAMISEMLAKENDLKVKTQIIQKVVEKIIVRKEDVEIYFFVGEQHYKRELDISGSRPFFGPKPIEKRNTSPLPVFHGNLETAEILDFNQKTAAPSGANIFHDAGSNSLKNGRGHPTTCNLTQVHDFIEFSISDFSDILAVFRRLYLQGHSLGEISKITGVPYSTIRDQLEKAGVTFRINKSVSSSVIQRQRFKSSTPPPFGYCYLNGSLQKDAREYPVLQIITEQWRRGKTPTEIARHLDGLKFRTRAGKVWRQAHVYNIVQRPKQEKSQ